MVPLNSAEKPMKVSGPMCRMALIKRIWISISITEMTIRAVLLFGVFVLQLARPKKEMNEKKSPTSVVIIHKSRERKTSFSSYSKNSEVFLFRQTRGTITGIFAAVPPVFLPTIRGPGRVMVENRRLERPSSIFNRWEVSRPDARASSCGLRFRSSRNFRSRRPNFLNTIVFFFPFGGSIG